MGTTTVRVDSETHARLLEMSAASGKSLIDTIRDATEALRRQRFAGGVTQELDRLRMDEATWVAYLAEADATDVPDGIR
jgi:predicted transcriptional regulator